MGSQQSVVVTDSMEPEVSISIKIFSLIIAQKARLINNRPTPIVKTMDYPL